MRDVLLVSPSAAPGGSERALEALARGLPEHGWRPTAVLLRRGPLEDWLTDAGVAMRVVDGGRVRNVHRTAAAVASIARELRTGPADVVLANMTKGQIYAGAAGALSRVPSVWWQHGMPGRSPLERAAAVFPARAVVCSTQRVADAQRKLTPRARLVEIAPGVDVTGIAARRGSGAELRREHGVDGPWIGIVGRLQPWKGQDVFLRAAALIAERVPNARFAVVGDAILGWEGSYPDELRQLAETLGIADRVDFVGHQDDPIAWMDAFDVVVHASEGEPFGLVVVEAMALGRPVVATRGGGPDDIVDDGHNGLLVAPRDHDEMAASVVRLLEDRDLAARIGAAAAERAAQFSERATAQRFADLFAEVAG
jgi:glycosyltransferase involved in cell wall biosynthesis